MELNDIKDEPPIIDTMQQKDDPNGWDYTPRYEFVRSCKNISKDKSRLVTLSDGNVYKDHISNLLRLPKSLRGSYERQEGDGIGLISSGWPNLLIIDVDTNGVDENLFPETISDVLTKYEDAIPCGMHHKKSKTGHFTKGHLYYKVLNVPKNYTIREIGIENKGIKYDVFLNAQQMITLPYCIKVRPNDAIEDFIIKDGSIIGILKEKLYCYTRRFTTAVKTKTKNDKGRIDVLQIIEDYAKEIDYALLNSLIGVKAEPIQKYVKIDSTPVDKGNLTKQQVEILNEFAFKMASRDEFHHYNSFMPFFSSLYGYIDWEVIVNSAPEAFKRCYHKHYHAISYLKPEEFKAGLAFSLSKMKQIFPEMFEKYQQDNNQFKGVRIMPTDKTNNLKKEYLSNEIPNFFDAFPNETLYYPFLVEVMESFPRLIKQFPGNKAKPNEFTVSNQEDWEKVQNLVFEDEKNFKASLYCIVCKVCGSLTTITVPFFREKKQSAIDHYINKTAFTSLPIKGSIIKVYATRQGNFTSISQYPPKSGKEGKPDFIE